MSYAKNWALTLNNPTDTCLGFDESLMNYMICGNEKGEKGTRHIQGYVQFKKRTRLTAIKKLWPRVHAEVARGLPQQNKDYCSKEEDWHEHGTLQPGQGTRNDLNELKELISKGARRDEIREINYGAYIRYGRAIRQDIRDCQKHRNWNTELYIHWGDTGTGKSRYCHETFPDAYWKSRGEWWDGYEGHEIVILDEFYGWLPISELLRLCDRYPHQVPVKGGFEKFVAREIHITSNKSWREWWPNITNETVLAAFERRITRCTHYKQLVNAD